MCDSGSCAARRAAKQAAEATGLPDPTAASIANQTAVPPRSVGSEAATSASLGTGARDEEHTRDELMLHVEVARALVALLRPEERSLPTLWLESLASAGNTSGATLETAAQYARYLSLALACGAGSHAPFHRAPPPRLADAPPISSDLWATALAACSLDVSWAQELAAAPLRTRAEPLDPREFFTVQPKPERGAICYMAAISDIPPF